jgi:hypothetical protein
MSEPNANSKCAICGKDYYLCIACKDKLAAEPWRLHTDTSEHFKIYQIIRGYNTGIYTKAEASEKLKTVDLSDMHTYLDYIQAAITRIMTEEKPKKDTAKKPTTKQKKARAKVEPKSDDINSEQ